MKWTDNDMIRFAELCGTNGECGFNTTTKKWLLDDVAEASTSALLDLYKKMQILPLPSPDDLQNIRFGPEQNNETKY